MTHTATALPMSATATGTTTGVTSGPDRPVTDGVNCSTFQGLTILAIGTGSQPIARTVGPALAGYETLVPSRWNEWTVGPMGGSLHTHPINVAVRKGERVPDPADAELAVAEARWLARRSVWSMWLAVAVGLLFVATAIATDMWWQVLLVLGAAGGTAVNYWQRKRYLRSIQLNETLIGTSPQDVRD